MIQLKSKTLGECIAESVPDNTQKNNLLCPFELLRVFRVDVLDLCFSQCLPNSYTVARGMIVSKLTLVLHELRIQRLLTNGKQNLVTELPNHGEEGKRDLFSNEPQEQRWSYKYSSKITNDGVA